MSDSSSSRHSSPDGHEPNPLLAENSGEVSETPFNTLGLIPELLQTVEALGYKNATSIQAQAIPSALQDRDIIGVAKTGSGKTAAFALPILQKWWEDPKPLYACILAPTRELAYQIQKQFEALGANLGVRCCCIVGGLDIMAQKVALAKRPHIVVATPGRLQDHLENTKGFSLRSLKYLVLDEADRLLDMDFGPIIDKILKVIPKERRTMLFSATMSTKVKRLQRASLVNPVKVEVSSKYSTVSTLQQYYVFGPHMRKEVNLITLVRSLSGKSIIVFTNTVNDTIRLTLMLRALNIGAIPLHSKLSQSTRLGSLNKFRAGGRQVLIATDVAARGLDIPQVDVVINYGVPQNSKDYIHRVGRTARAGRAGKAITFVTQYDIEFHLRIEEVIGKKMDEWVIPEQEAAMLAEKVEEAGRAAAMEMKDMNLSKGKEGKRKRDDMDRDDDSVPAGTGVGRKKRR
ncbi:ATP-dependent rRNA helicase RRP3 {ECO:0000305} {ECO:0000250/UniProtKB:P38712} [Serendipita indica DSM 11827]|nr:ATP-dependent rRNA helicase RRP3 {ECO:0000305} {ECO:0000250/UniProtKB:P38712} [Serendipita indica DSM 11827]